MRGSTSRMRNSPPALKSTSGPTEAEALRSEAGSSLRSSNRIDLSGFCREPRSAPGMSDYPHAMLREIYEQPDAIRRTLDLYLDGSGLDSNAFEPLAGWLNARGEVLIAASGSSRHAGLAAEILLEDLCGLAVDVEYASEYSTRGGVALRHPSVI